MSKSKAGWQGGELRGHAGDGRGFTFTYGYAEARIKFPPPPPGLIPWPAFWFLSVPPKGTPQTRTELDVIEPGLSSPTDIEVQSTTIHEWPEKPLLSPEALSEHTFWGFAPTYKTFDDQWHTYGFLREKDWWVVFRDRVEFGRLPVLGGEMDFPVYPLLDVALNFAPTANNRAR